MAEKKFLKNWNDVDQTQAADQYKSYLNDVTAIPSAQVYKQQSYALLRAGVGQQILDVGCGNGDDVRALAKLVSPTGTVIGVDNSQNIVTTAQNHPDNADLSVKFQLGDAHCLTFEDNVFHGSRADRVFQHLRDREQALAEMIRVTRSGGWIIVIDPDWETLVVDAPDNVALTRKILNYIADHATIHGWTGRQLYRLFKQACLLDVSVYSCTAIFTEFELSSKIFYLESAVQEMVEADLLSADTALAWLGYLQQVDREGYFYSAMSIYGVCGQKP